ncbi:MBOAT family protein [Pseudonocardia sp. TRM90224]|uniref:MBOAT family protein n=1 Tax=Pseudonocardia sp. TRM90224 TaxID=2812678 RepID=UPI001E3C1E98|nr:MBOAT family protein [Pseudonocardia sp. TRM90224]
MNASVERLIWVLVVLFLGCKVAVLCSRRPAMGRRTWLFLLWPGMDPRPFVEPAVPQRGWPWLGRGTTGLLIGVLGGFALQWAAPGLNPDVVGWLGVAVILTAFHMGFTDVVTAALRRAGYPVRRLFRDPLLSRSLGEFWSRRWNLAYVELNQVLFVPLLRRRVGRRGALAAAFVLSGVFHELAISFPVQAGYGGPLAYFTLHAALAAVEPRLRVVHWPDLAARLWTWFWVLAPLPLLFHAPFRSALVTPLFWS